MNDDRPSNPLYRKVKIIGVYLLALFILEFFFGPIAILIEVVKVNSYQSELLEAKQKWKESGITDYDLDVYFYLPPMCLYETTIQVRENHMILEEPSSSWMDCNSYLYGVSDMFLKVEQELEDIQYTTTSIRLRFDPEYGYITRYEYRYLGGRGLLTPVIGDCCSTYTFTNFKPLTSISP